MKHRICFTLLLSLGLLSSSYTHAQSTYSPPWTLGDETTVACFTIVPEGQSPTFVNVTGVDIQYILPLNNPLTVGMPINASVEIKVETNFFSGNDYLSDNYTITPAPASLEFSQLCLQPLGTGTNNCAAPVNASNCCIWHMNWHFCPSSIVSSENCLPWVNATTTSSGQSVLLTGSPAQTGLLNSVFPSDTFALTNVSSTDMYTVLAHFRMANIQCAIGANRRIIFGTTTSSSSPTANATVTATATAAPSSDNSNSQAVIIGGSIGGGVAVAAIAAFLFFCMRRKSNSPQNFSDPKADIMRQSMVFNNDQGHRPYSDIRPSNSGHPSTIGGSPVPSEAHYAPNLTAPFSTSQPELNSVPVSPVGYPPAPLGMQYVVPDLHGAFSHPPGTYYIPVTYPQGIPAQLSSYMTNSPPPSTSAMSVPGFGFPIPDNRSMSVSEEMQKPNHDGFLIASPGTISSSTTSHSSTHDQNTGPYGQQESQ